MDSTPNVGDLHKIVVLNPKGGSGKTTLATNLAAYYAQRGPISTLVDCDPQGFSMRWLEKRPRERPSIQGVAAFGEELGAPDPGARPSTGVVIIDLPAAIPRETLHDYSHLADSILIPIVPSEIDVYAASRLIAELMLDAQLDRRDHKLAIVANRVRANTRSFLKLTRFLSSLRIPMIAALRDTQNYVYAAANGIGICEMPAYAVKSDIGGIRDVAAWLDKWHARRRAAEAVLEFERLADADVRHAESRGTID